MIKKNKFRKRRLWKFTMHRIGIAQYEIEKVGISNYDTEQNGFEICSCLSCP